MKKILLIEDDRFIRDLVSFKFYGVGLDVQMVSSAEEAEVMLGQETVDLILLDLELPQMQGAEFLENLRQIESQKSIPVIIFSNNDEPEMKELCRKLGIEEFFVKINTDFDELISCIQKVLS